MTNSKKHIVLVALLAISISSGLTASAQRRSTDYGNPRQGNRGWNNSNALTGTYRLDSSRSDDVSVVVQRATRGLSPGIAGGNERPGAGTSSAAQSTSLPLTPGKKFNYFARSSFLSPTSYALSIASGVFSEATDSDHDRHMSSGDFLADSMTHAARSFAFRATANFFEKFAYAAAFKQDPRYFRSDKKVSEGSATRSAGFLSPAVMPARISSMCPFLPED